MNITLTYYMTAAISGGVFMAFARFTVRTVAVDDLSGIVKWYKMLENTLLVTVKMQSKICPPGSVCESLRN